MSATQLRHRCDEWTDAGCSPTRVDGTRRRPLDHRAGPRRGRDREFAAHSPTGGKDSGPYCTTRGRSELTSRLATDAHGRPLRLGRPVERANPSRRMSGRSVARPTVAPPERRGRHRHAQLPRTITGLLTTGSSAGSTPTGPTDGGRSVGPLRRAGVSPERPRDAGTDRHTGPRRGGRGDAHHRRRSVPRHAARGCSATPRTSDARRRVVVR